MKPPFKTFAGCVTIALFGALQQTPANAQAPLNPAGSYSISHGMGPGGSEYSGEVEIEDLGDEVFSVGWNTGGGTAYHGIGLHDQNGLAAAWSDADSYGLVIYKVEGGKLYGDWISNTTEFDLGTESLEGPSGLNGVYQIVDAAGEDGGAAYSGTVEIRPSGQIYRLTWHINNIVYTGVGLLRGDFLFVGWGIGAGVIYYEIKGDELIGRWASQSSDQVGSETLVRDRGIQ
ncbi:MAG TPA: hypothetical protein VL688_03220 [Verrucomicrobiae bacterium]|jgi:hypothetical protein|nr:hypothetical protein [Verrucomicrobiae bacterium]